MSKAFTHLDADARRKGDVGGKASTERVARAQARVFMSAETPMIGAEPQEGDVLLPPESPGSRLRNSAAISSLCHRSC